MSIGIYRITSPSGKIYIGQSINIPKRFGYYRGLRCKQQPKLYYSLLKHGYGNHKMEIIEECLREDLNIREMYWKQDYINKNGWKKALFCKIYDPRDNSEEFLKQLSEVHKGKVSGMKNKKHTEEAKEKNRQAHLGQIPWMKGKNHTKQAKNKNSESNKGRIPWNKGVKSSEWTKLKQSLGGKEKAKDPKWKDQQLIYLKQAHDLVRGTKYSPDRIKKAAEGKYKPVFQLDEKGIPIKEWSSQKQINQVLGINITNVICGFNKTAGGFGWVLKAEYEKNKLITLN